MKNIEVMITKEEISRKVAQIGRQIANDYKESVKTHQLVVICVLKGSFIFTADLVREIDLPLLIDFIRVKSYEGTQSTGNVVINKELDFDVAGKDVILVEDILDTGRTLSILRDKFLGMNANSVKICTFLDKKEGRIVDINADYICYDIPNKFVIGYGLDWDEDYRNLPYVGNVVS